MQKNDEQCRGNSFIQLLICHRHIGNMVTNVPYILFPVGHNKTSYVQAEYTSCVRKLERERHIGHCPFAPVSSSKIN